MDPSKLKSFYTRKDPLIVYKMVTTDGDAPWGVGSWDLPKDGKKGRPRRIKGTPIPCRRGIHGCPDLHSLLCFGLDTGFHPRLFVAELWGAVACDDDKVAAQAGRLVREITTWDRDEIYDYNLRMLRDHESNMYFRDKVAHFVYALHARLHDFPSEQQ